MKYSIITNLKRSYLLIFFLVLSSPCQASETKQPVSPDNPKAFQLDVHNNQITGMIKKNSLKHVLLALRNKLGFTLQYYGDDITRYRITQNYYQKDTLSALRDMLDEFDYVIITNSDLSIEKVLILGLKRSRNTNTESSDTLVVENEMPDQTLMLNETFEDLVPPKFPISSELQVFNKKRFLEQLEQEMDI